MFKVTANGAFVGYSDTVVYITISANGSYIPTDANHADGICVKLPTEIYDEGTGETIQTTVDTVFSLPGKELPGVEREADIEEISGALALDEAETIVRILTGGAQ